MRNYEIAVVLHPDLEIDLEATIGKIEKILVKNDAKIVKKDNWGKRKLAYKINKQDWGIYVFYQVQVEPSLVTKINQSLRITEEVIRYLIVSLENIQYLKNPSKTKKETEPETKPETETETVSKSSKSEDKK